jgi:hypothetical protein
MCVKKTQSDKVDYMFWLSNDNKESFALVERFYDEYLTLNDERVSFTPHYVTWFCHTCKVAGWKT